MTLDASCAIYTLKLSPKVTFLEQNFFFGIDNTFLLCNTNDFKWYSHTLGQLSKYCLDAPIWHILKTYHYKIPV